jgi:hypothetical protein
MTQKADMPKVQVGATAGSESRAVLKTTASAPARVGLGSHAGSHTDEQPRDAPNPCGQPGETNPRSRTDLNGSGRPHWNLRICECVVTAVLGVLPPGSVPVVGVTRYGSGRCVRAFLLTCPRVAGPAWPTMLA